MTLRRRCALFAIAGPALHRQARQERLRSPGLPLDLPRTLGDAESGKVPSDRAEAPWEKSVPVVFIATVPQGGQPSNRKLLDGIKFRTNVLGNLDNVKKCIRSKFEK